MTKRLLIISWLLFLIARMQPTCFAQSFRLASVTDEDGETLSYVYDEKDRVSEMHCISEDMHVYIDYDNNTYTQERKNKSEVVSFELENGLIISESDIDIHFVYENGRIKEWLIYNDHTSGEAGSLFEWEDGNLIHFTGSDTDGDVYGECRATYGSIKSSSPQLRVFNTLAVFYGDVKLLDWFGFALWQFLGCKTDNMVSHVEYTDYKDSETYISDYNYELDENGNIVKITWIREDGRTYYFLLDWEPCVSGNSGLKEIVPEEDKDVDYSTDATIGGDAGLDGHVVGNVYYNISDSNGEYSSTEGCIIVRKPTSDEQVSSFENGLLTDEELMNGFTGIIFMVPAGSGVVKVNAETTGSLTLKVKVGNNPPNEIELEGKMKAKFPYNVSESSYVYIYAGETVSSAKGMMKVAGSGELKIYGIEIESGASGIDAVSDEAQSNDILYNLNGQRVERPTKNGVYILNGKKVVFKN